MTTTLGRTMLHPEAGAERLQLIARASFLYGRRPCTKAGHPGDFPVALNVAFALWADGLQAEQALGAGLITRGEA